MHNIALTWKQASLLGLALLVAATLARHMAAGSGAPRSRFAQAWRFPREAAVIAGLYALWQLAGSLSLVGTKGAFVRARWIQRTERDLRLPSERSVQGLILGHPLLAQLCNLFYASMHFAALFALLLWLFIWHRDQYPRIRTQIVLLTLGCLLIQLWPVAPPRLLPGYVDVAARYGQSVYGTFGQPGADQLSAMPSVHVGWAVLVALTVIQVSHSPWRWWIVCHPVITTFVVIATGNHFWLDGVVAIALLVAAILAQRAVRLRRPSRSNADSPPRVSAGTPAS